MEKISKNKDKEDKEEKAKMEREKEYAIKAEIEKTMTDFTKSKIGMKQKTYLPLLESIIDKWAIKLKEKEVADELYNSTIKLLDFGLAEKELNTFYESLTEDRKVLLSKVYFNLYEKISNKQNVGNIKASKINSIHNKLIENEGVGFVGRSFFSIQK